MRNAFLKATNGLHFGALALALILAACGKDDAGEDSPRDPGADVTADGGSAKGDAGKDGGKADASTQPSDDDDDVPTADDAGSDDDTPLVDAGRGGGSDAGGRTDTAVQGPVSTTLAAALKTDGVDGSEERAGLLFTAACKARQACEDGVTCEQDIQGLWQSVTKAGLDTGCRDATLDVIACAVAKKSCEPVPECQALIASRGECLAALAPR